MKRDLIASSVRCRNSRIRWSTACSIIGIALVLFSLTWIEGSAGMRNQPTLRLLSIGSRKESDRKAMFEVVIAPDLFGSEARFGWPLSGQKSTVETPILEASKKPIRLASMERKTPSRGRTRKS
jgi:hypothetical protein